MQKSEWERLLSHLKALGEEGAQEYANQWLAKLAVLDSEKELFKKLREDRKRGLAAMRHYKVKSAKNRYKIISYYIQDRFNSEDTTARIQSEMFTFLAIYRLANTENIDGWQSIAELPLLAPSAQMVKDFYAVVELMRNTGKYKAVVIPHYLSAMPEDQYQEFAERSLRKSVKNIIKKALLDFVSLTGPVLNNFANRRRKKGQPKIHIQLEENLEKAIAYLQQADWNEAISKNEQDLEFSGLIDLIVPTPKSGIDIRQLRDSA